MITSSVLNQFLTQMPYLFPRKPYFNPDMRKPWYIAIFLGMVSLLICHSAKAGPDTIVLRNGNIKFNKERAFVFHAEQGVTTSPLGEVMDFKFYPRNQLDKELAPRRTYWAKYVFKCKEEGHYYFYFGKGEYITAFFLWDNGMREIKHLGEFTKRSEADVKDISKSAQAHFKEGQTATVYVKVRNETNFSPRLSLHVTTGEQFIDQMVWKRLVIQTIFHAILWTMILYNLLLWISIGDRSYIYYSLYMVAISTTFFLHDQIHYHLFTALAEFPRVMYFVEIVAAQLSIVLYFVFMQSLLGTKRLLPFWHKFTVGWIVLKLVALPFLIYYNTYHILGNMILEGLLFFEFSLLFITCIILFFKRDKVALYFAIGSIFLAACGMLTAAGWYGMLEIGNVEHLIQFGIIGQIIIFSLGLGFKSRRNAGLVFELQKKNEALVDELKLKVKEQEKTLRTFIRYVPEPVVAQALNKHEEESYFDGELRVVSVLFCDIRAFTTISEELKAKQVVNFLNEFYSLMTVTIKKYGGSINQFIGDEIFAVFGAPISTSNNEKRVVLAAIEMIEKVQWLSEKYKPEFGRDIQVGIGIHNGEVVAGNMGSEEKIEYSVIGDTVNTGKRLEGLTKDVPNSIIISEQVYMKVAPFVRVQQLPVVHLKGKRNSMKVYRVLGKK